MASHEHIEGALRQLDAAKQVAVDVETSGLSWQRNHIVGWVLTFGPRPEDSHYFPVRHAGGENIPGCDVPRDKDGWVGDVHPLETEFVKRLDRPDLLVIGHNLSFDLRFLYRVGCKFQAKYSDTIIGAPLINEFQAGFSLDACAKVAKVAAKKTTIYDYLCERFPEARANPKQAMGHFWRLAGDDPQAVEYACQDGTTTWQLWLWQRAELVRQELGRVYGVESRLIPVLARMMTRGVRIDEDRLHAVKGIVEGRRDAALKSLPDEFNSRSPNQVKALMEGNGHTDWPLTPKGAPSFPEKWLETNPVGKNIVAVRKYSNLLNSFINPMITTHLWRGRVHPTYNQLRGDEFGTITGRLSSSDPNLQQVSKRNEELGRLHRSIFVPDGDMVWGSVDYRQCEPTLLAYYSRSKVLLEGFRAAPPLDSHTAVAIAIKHNPDITKAERENAKRINQTLISGGGKKKIMEAYGVPPGEMDKIWDDYFEAMPEIRTLQRRASKTMQERGYVLDLLGRRARLNDPNKSYVAINRLLQCSNASILKVKMCEVDEYLRSEGDRVNLLNNVHDALDYQFSEEDRKIYNNCLAIMQSFGEDDMIKLDVPLGVDPGEGPNWSDATWGPEK